MSSEKAMHMAQQVVAKPDDYPTPVFQAAMMLLLDSDSKEMQAVFLEVYGQASTVKNIFVGRGLAYPSDQQAYYEPAELNQPGVEIGTEPLNSWTLKLFPQQLRRHLVVVGATGTGKTNLLLLLAVGLAEIDK